jgi:hypothetical protein
VPGDYSIADLHFILQIAFDWDDWNLRWFFIHGKDYGIYHSGGMSFSDDPYQVRLADFKFRRGERFLYEYDFFLQSKTSAQNRRHFKCQSAEAISLLHRWRNLSISESESKAAEFAEIEAKISNQLKAILPAFLKEYQEPSNFVTDQENAGKAIAIIREKVRRLQEEAEEIKCNR